jgi:hypothetical protein
MVRALLCRDCPKIGRWTRGRCPTCERTHDKARGTRQQRGYDAQYDAERAAWQRRLDAGEAITCWRCAELGRPHLVDPKRWHLGHDNHDRSVIRGPQCPDSNLTDAGKHPGGGA